MYIAHPNRSRWAYANIVGNLAFVKDPSKNNALFFKIIDFAGDNAVWEQELYQGFEYSQDGNAFHTFATDNYVAAFCFANQSDPISFYNLVKNSLRSGGTPKGSLTNLSNAFKPTSPRNSVSLQGSNGSSSYDASGVMSMFGFGKKKEKKKKGIDKAMIGAPKDFKHISHVGYDPSNGFNLQNIPEKWRATFRDAGFTDEQLQDPKFAKKVKKIIDEIGGDDENFDPTKPVQRLPPPPPARQSVVSPSNAPQVNRQAPPPPPSRRSVPPPVPSSRPTSVAAPPVPHRSSEVESKPSLPSRSPLSVPSTPIASSGGAPPPPPPPPAIPSPTTAASPKSAPSAPKSSLPPVADGRSNLLAQIRSVKKDAVLKKVADEPTPVKKSPSQEGASGAGLTMADVLKARMNEMRVAVGDDDSDEDDDDWED